MNYYLKLFVITLFIMISVRDQASDLPLKTPNNYGSELLYAQNFFDSLSGKGDPQRHLILARNVDNEVRRTTGYPCILSAESWKKIFEKTEKDYKDCFDRLKSLEEQEKLCIEQQEKSRKSLADVCKKIIDQNEKNYLEEEEKLRDSSDLLLRAPIQVTSGNDIMYVQRILQHFPSTELKVKS